MTYYYDDTGAPLDGIQRFCDEFSEEFPELDWDFLDMEVDDCIILAEGGDTRIEIREVTLQITSEGHSDEYPFNWDAESIKSAIGNHLDLNGNHLSEETVDLLEALL